uniref:Large ribosomal subunit protein bL32c n=3 Tax=Vischeria TaxID=44431 RepID=A0A5P8SZL4_9STRA|nr:ribosomal protein L32 [Vischeria sp. ACOI 3415]YP_010451086.1 ribosomal protein L32 [Vischeria punctata]AOW70868.1 ribosomal protein L32 [Vischeria sp. CAUP Q 202]QFR99680.1 ribosomal protein L32 [Vischeria stellata]QAA12115.1 ribosomal protein L32 [Vischeria sp. ACOI 3415]UTV00867.1 ribosomal protein L32 [Vischeria punctata]
MAVPKKRTSRTKTKTRKAQWFRKAYIASQKAWSLSCSIANGNSNSFVLDKSVKSN